MSPRIHAPRDRATRKVEALARLSEPAVDVWVSTASPTGDPYLVPLSLAWVQDRAVLAVDGASPTARNVAATGTARLGVGPTRDVVVIDTVVERTTGVDDDPDLGAAYAAQADWDPRGIEGYIFIVLRPERIQAWRESNELSGRLLMRDGMWLV
jgi:hypothetical protein